MVNTWRKGNPTCTIVHTCFNHRWSSEDTVRDDATESTSNVVGRRKKGATPCDRTERPSLALQLPACSCWILIKIFEQHSIEVEPMNGRNTRGPSLHVDVNANQGVR